jgi:hypothetical protein
MLEPAVRPGGASQVAPDRAGPAPFESRPFDQLLQEAKTKAAPPDENPEAEPPATRPLAELADITRIENASLRQQLESARNAGTLTQNP